MILFYIYIFWVIIWVILWIVNIRKISENRSNLYYTIRNYSKVWFYFEPSLWIYGEIRWDPDRDWYIKKKSLTGLFIKRAILMPWLSWIYVIKYIFKVVDNIKYDLNKPERLKEIECIINSWELTTDEMLELILEMDYKIHYWKFIYVPILKKRSNNRVFVDDEWCSIKEWQTRFKEDVLLYGKDSDRDYEKKYFILNKNTIVWHDSDSFRYDVITYEYKIEGNKVLIKCIDYKDWWYKSWRNWEDFCPIAEWSVDVNAIERDIRWEAESEWKIKWKEREKLINERVKEKSDHYKRLSEWHELGKTFWDKWVDIYVLSQKMDYRKFENYINWIIKDINHYAWEIKDLCKEYGTSIKFNKEWEAKIWWEKWEKKWWEKKQETFVKEIDNICGKCPYALDSKKYIKIFEHILEFAAEDAVNRERWSEFVNWEKPENLFK